MTRRWKAHGEAPGVAFLWYFAEGDGFEGNASVALQKNERVFKVCAVYHSMVLRGESHDNLDDAMHNAEMLYERLVSGEGKE